MWGVGIQIAAIQKDYIPFCIFVLDMLFSNLLGERIFTQILHGMITTCH